MFIYLHHDGSVLSNIFCRYFVHYAVLDIYILSISLLPTSLSLFFLSPLQSVAMQ